MKKLLLSVLAVFISCMILPASAAVYTASSVTDCAQKSTSYDRFYRETEFSVLVPGLREGLVPQGLGYIAQDNALLFAGYRTDQGASALIEVSLETGEILRQAELKTGSGEPYKGHAGGVCATDKNIYVANAGKLLRLPLIDFLNVSGASTCTFKEEIPVPVTASYCSFDGKNVWVGEFQYGSEYKTDASHKLRSADGLYQAWVCAFPVDDDAESGLCEKRLSDGTLVPEIILSTTERIQGMTVFAGRILLSQSYGRRNSSMLYAFEDVSGRAPDAQAQLGEYSIPIYLLDKNTRTDAVMMPPMSECLCTAGDKVYILFESGAKTYMNKDNPSVNPIDRVVTMTKIQ